jgi:hypothetical protein
MLVSGAVRCDGPAVPVHPVLCWYCVLVHRADHRCAPARLLTVRVRTFELRLIGVALVACWTLTAALVLLAYRPGGPIDIVVGVLACAPVAIALAAVIWPPLTHGERSFPAMVWLGIAALLVLVPSMAGLLVQLRALGSQTLLPSPEAAYPWLVALAATSLFAGFGIARAVLGQTAMRRRRLVRGLLIATALTAVTSVLLGGAALANDIAMRDRTPVASRFGPTDPEAEPSLCTAPLEAGPAADLSLTMRGEIDLRPVGTVELAGSRSRDDYRWLAYVASDRQLATHGRAYVDGTNWVYGPNRGWRRTGDADPGRFAIDRAVMNTVLTEGFRATAEDRGIEVIEGARARRCRVAVDGETFVAAFPQVRWLVGDADLHRWRGQLDYWVFLDGQLGQVAGSVNGDSAGIEADTLLGTVELLLTATNRTRDVVIYPPRS